MNLGRYKHTDWLLSYKRRRAFLFDCAVTRNCPAKALENGARLLLEAHYCGPWRMLWALFKAEVDSWWLWYVWRPAHVIKRKLGFRPNKHVEMFEAYEREAERRDQEEAAVEEMVRQL